MIPRVFRLAPTLCLLGLRARNVRATCFFPNGDAADAEHKVCDASATDGTTCCVQGYECLSNGLCNDIRYPDWQRVLRGACTDKGFGGSCNSVCVDYWPQGDEAVWYCGSGKYCCSRVDDCCNDSKVEKHDLGEPKIAATAGKTPFRVSSTATTTSQTGAVSSAAPPSPSTSNSPTGAIAGGVIGGILVLFLLFTSLWFFRRRRKARQDDALHELPAGSLPSAQSPHQAYKYNEKAGGWVGSKRKKGRKGNGNVVFETVGDRRVELPVEMEPVEMDSGVVGNGARGLGTEEIGRRSLLGSRRSRFMEEGVEMNDAQVGRGPGNVTMTAEG